MNGCQYGQKRFTLPAGAGEQIKWDLAFLSKKEFIAKYGEAKYAELTK